MKYKRLGGTGLLVSELCMGTMTFGGKDPVSMAMGALGKDKAGRLIDMALDAGINFFDTANVYGEGESERILGEALRSKRHDVVIATKIGFRTGPGANDVGLSRGHIIQQTEESLKRLGTEYIDLLQIHRPDHITEWEETMSTLDYLINSGKVRYIGCSNLQGFQIMKANEIARQRKQHTFQTTQSYYSLVGRDVEREIVPTLQDQKMGMLVWSPLAGGFLSGKYKRNIKAQNNDRRSKFNFPPVDENKGFDIVDVLDEIASESNVSLAQISLAWLLQQPVVSSVILGAKHVEQLRDNLQATSIELTKEELEHINQVSVLQPEYPWGPAVYGEDRVISQI